MSIFLSTTVEISLSFFISIHNLLVSTIHLTAPQKAANNVLKYSKSIFQYILMLIISVMNVIN